MAYYHMVIWNYGRCMDFHTEEELRAELVRYFTKSEIQRGIVDRLMAFGEPNENGYTENKYQSFSVIKYF